MARSGENPVEMTDSGPIEPSIEREPTPPAGETAAEPTGDVSRETSPVQPSKVQHRIAVINQKGGVGKTTTAVNIAWDFAGRGLRTLLLDLDPQGNASTSLGIDRYGEGVPTSNELLFNPPEEIPRPLPHPEAPHLYLYAGNVSLIQADVGLLDSEGDRQAVLASRLGLVADEFDIIVVDSPPSLGLLTLNILVASNWATIPVQCEYLALEGLTMLLDTLEEIQAEHNTRLQILGCLITMCDLRTNLSQQVVAEIRTHIGDKVFDTMIPRTVRLSECPSHGKSIFQYDRWGAGARSYEALCDEILKRLEIEAESPRRKKK